MVTLILRCCRWITQTSAGAVEITSWLLIFLYCVNLYVFSTSLPPDIAIRSSMNLFKVLLVPSLFTSSCVSGQRYSDGYRLRRLAALLNISSWPWYCLSWLCYLLDSGSVVQHDHSSLPLHPRDSGLNCDAYRCNPMHTRTDPIGAHLGLCGWRKSTGNETENQYLYLHIYLGLALPKGFHIFTPILRFKGSSLVLKT